MEQQRPETALERQIRQGLGPGRLQVWYQPQYSLVTGGLVGAEALARWQGENQIFTPDRFLPAVEQAGLAVQLDRAVLDQVCRDILEARARGLRLGTLWVNLSRENLASSQVPDQIRALTLDREITGRDLSFEITEGAARQSNQGLASLVSGLQALGFSVAMDDFGAGGSDLRTLALASFDGIKLDRSLVSLAEGNRFGPVLDSLVTLSRRLEMGMVAEGVENARQAEILRQAGCPAVQGFYYSRPVPREEFFHLAEQEARP